MVVQSDRRAELERLSEPQRPRAGELGAYDARNEPGDEHAVGDASAATHLAGEAIVHVKRVPVAGQLGEALHVVLADDNVGDDPLADTEGVEGPGLQCALRQKWFIQLQLSSLRVSVVTSQLRSVLRRLESEAATWRDEPIRRVAVRNKILHPWRQHRFYHFGAGSFIDRPGWIYGPQQIWVGDLVMILAG